jgi:hypothetical protein
MRSMRRTTTCLAVVMAVVAGLGVSGVGLRDVSVPTIALAEGVPAPIPAAMPAPVAASAVVWEEWVRLVGAVDVAGVRTDGRMVVVAAGKLYLVSMDGAVTPFAQGEGGYSGSADVEPYAVVVPDLPGQPGQPGQVGQLGQPGLPGQTGCVFQRDDVFILDFGPPGLLRVDPAGRVTRFATFANVDWLYGIALDTVGRFGYRLLVSGAGQERNWVLAVDCMGGVTTVTDQGPVIEGGYEVAPADFGAFGGDLIAPDELSGQIWAFSPDGRVRLVATPELPSGGDTGVESVGFVPRGFLGGNGAVYLADRGTPENPFPGTDSVLRLSAQALVAAGVQEGDLLVATEGGGATVAVRCGATCSVLPIADGPAGGTAGHIEGHIIFSRG